MGDFTLKDVATIGTAAALGVFTGGTATAALIGAGIGTTVIMQRKASAAQENELKVQQRVEEQSARVREVQRRERFVALLGSQSAEAAARGLQMSGSVANISLTDAQRAGNESQIDQVNTRNRIDALSRNRATIISLSTFRTATTILGGAERIAARG